MSSAADQPFQQASVIDSYALSPTQAGMLFHALRHAPGEGIDVQQIGMTILSPLDPGLFVYAWYQAMERHAVLRTRFRWEGLKTPPVQEVLDAVELPVTRVDWRGAQPEVLRERLLARASAERAEGFNLAKAPLMRLFMARVGDSAWSVLWTFHHAILDGRSFPVVLREVFDIHDALRGRREPSLPLPMPFRRYIELCEGAATHAAETYWRGVLAGVRGTTSLGLELPAGLVARSPVDQPFGARQLNLSASLSQALVQRAQAASLSVATLLQAAWALMLHRCSGRDDVVFGSTRSTRHQLGRESADGVGLFIVTVPLRVQMDRAQTVDDWLACIRAQQLAMRPHEHLPLVRIQACAGASSENPLFDTLVVFDQLSLAARMRALGPAWTHRHFDHVGQTGYPMALIAYGDESMPLRLEYDRRRYSDATAERLLGHVQTVLQALAEDRHERVGQLPWLTPEQRDSLLGRRPVHFEPKLPLHRHFERQAHRTPLAPALTVVDDQGARHEISYGRLNAQANRLARRLRSHAIGSEHIVGLRAERNADVVLGILAILKAGAAYLPLDPVYPRERAAFMLQDAGVRLMLVSHSLDEAWDLPGVDCLAISEGRAHDDASALLSWDEAETDLELVVAPSDPAYVMYTSGSTGQPKGVTITHHNVERLFAATQGDFAFDERDVWTLFHSYAFDFSVWEMWGALLHGGRLVVVSQALSRDVEAFVELLVRERVTVLNQTPTAFKRLVDVARAGPAAPLSLRYVVFGGEALELQMLRPWFERYGDTRPQLVNMYGITETTVHVTRRVVRQLDLDEGLGSVIGEPLADLRLLLLDRQGELVPVGAAGELVVGGDGLSPGYLKRAQLTAERFVPDTLGGEPGQRLYRSGDLARWLDNGELEYLGRGDQQVKVRGFRIELGDIEAQLARHPQVKQAAVVVREDEPGDRRLVAYVVPVPGLGLSDTLIRQQRAGDLLVRLRETLPEYMVPAHVVFVGDLPLTVNGKLDAQALPAVDAGRATALAAAVERQPLTTTQSLLAQVWASVLRREHVDIHEHFFALGGDSILSIQVVARCRDKGLRLSLKDLFDYPTIHSLAQRIDESVSAANTALAPATSSRPLNAVAPSLPQASIHQNGQPDHPLSPIQQWFFDQHFAEDHHWNQALCLEVFEGVTPEQLSHALMDLYAQHPALCLRFSQDAQGHVSVSASQAHEQAPMVHVDLRNQTEAAAQATLNERAVEAHAGLNLSRGPLVRAVHFRFAHGPARLLLVIHHLVVDGVSWRILREDLEELIESRRYGRAARLPAKTASMDEWVGALQAYARQPTVQAAESAWLAVGSLPVNQLPKPPGLRAKEQGRERTHLLRLGAEPTRRLLQQVGAHFGTSVNAALLSALMRALAARTQENQWRIDMEGHGREPIDEQLDVSRTVGWFTSLFPVGLSLADAPALHEPAQAVRALHQQLLQVHDRGLSFGVLRWLGPQVVQDRLAQVPPASLLFNYLGQFDAVVSGSTLFRFAEESSGPWRSSAAHRSHALELVVLVRDGMLELTASHDDQRVDAVWVADLLGAWALALQELIATVEPAQPANVHVQQLLPAAKPSVVMPPTPAAKVSQPDQATPSSTGPFALTPIQKLFFVMDQVRPELGLQQWQFVLDGPLNPVRLRRALMRVLERHDVLRSAFWESPDRQALQQAMPVVDVPWEEEDWRELAGSEPARRLAQRLVDDQRQGFDLRKPPLMRVRLLRLADTTWHLIWTTHHLTLDGWSWPLVMGEWSRTYAALESGWAPVEAPAMSYRHFVEWRLQNSQEHASFWRGLLSGFAAPTAVAARSPSAQDSPATECVIDMQEAQCLRLAALARRWRVTPATLAHAAWAVCLAHASGASRVLFGTTLAGRPPELPGVETLVGPCINNLPVPISLNAKLDLGAWLAAIQKQQAALADHQYTPLEHIQQASAMAWRHRLFDSLLVFQNNQMDPDVARMGAHVRSTLIAVPEATNVPLTLSITPTTGWRLRFMASRGSGLGEADLRLWVEDLMAAWAALDGLGARAERGELADVGEWLALMPRASANRVAARRPDWTAESQSPSLLMPPPSSPAKSVAPPSSQAPATVMEAELAGVWRELLGADDVPLTTNYFDMGVHSLLLVRAHQLINERLHLQLPLLALLQHASIRALAHHIESATPDAETDMAQAALQRVRKLRDAQRKNAARQARSTDV